MKTIARLLLIAMHGFALAQADAPLGTIVSSLPMPPGTHPTAAAQAQALESAKPANPVEPKEFNDADLWERVRRGFALGELNSPLVLQQEQWYASRPDYIQRFVDRGSKYLHHIVEEVEKRGMPMEVAILPIIESAFNPQAFSSAKAAGMWQFIPSTGKNFGLKQDWMADNRRDVVLSTGAALDYLQKLYRMFNSWELAFAAYNCGEGCVGRAIARNQRLGLPADYLSLTLPPETRNYVPKLIAVKNILLSPGSYGIELEAVENRPYFARVAAPEKIDIHLAARLAEMPEEEFAHLNPAFNRPVAASGTGYFLVPIVKAETFRSNLELYRSLDGPMVSWQTVNAKAGESIDAIAKRHGVTGSYLRATNGALREKKGKLTQAATIMLPMSGKAKIISATLEQKVALKAAQPTPDNSPPSAANTDTKIAALAVPVAIDAVKPVALAGPAVAAYAVADDLAIPPGTHVVKQGETLFAISQRYGVTVDQIKAFNEMKTSQLRIGQSLVLNGIDAGIAASSNPPALVRVSTQARIVPQKPATYTVRPGDTLYAIALKFAVQLDDLLRWNKLHAKSVLQPGNRIRLTV